ncbi:MAG: GyrI-like domain-containing protein [Brumimicrobium sp.]|nr:GyrI-like domain-containing protein [Brumimicrobium sp.]
MKKLLKYIIIFFVLILGLFFIIPLFLDKNYKVERSVKVNIEKNRAHEYLRDFSRFEEWSPWKELDSAAVITMEGELGEVGSTYIWSGNEDIGSGSMTITEIKPDTIKILLKFVEPFESESMTYYALSGTNGSTEITWAMEGEMPYPWNIMTLFISMEEQVGKDFEKGLNKLKAKLESLPKEKEEVSSKEVMIERINLPERTFLGKREVVTFEEMEKFYSTNFSDLYGKITEKGIAFAGAPSGLYFTWEPDKNQADMAAAIPIQSTDAKLEGYESWVLGGDALKIVHMGSYEDLAKPHEAMEKYIIDNKLTTRGPALEEYISDPGTEPDTSKWVTHIYYFIENKQ